MESTETRWQRHVDEGRRFVSQGNYAEAEQSLLAAVKEALTLGPADLRVASSLGILGKLKHRQGERERAQGFLERALAVREEALGPDHYGVVQGLNDLAALHYAYGHIAEARALYERALSIAEKKLAPDHADIALALYNLSRVYFKSGDHLRAEPLLTRLLAIKERTLGGDHTDVAAILTALSRVRSMAGRHDEAEAMARRALAIREHALAPDDQAIAVSLELVAYFCAGRAKRMRSLADAERILGSARAASSDEHSDDESSERSLDAELALLASEEKALRDRARVIRGGSSGNREPSTLERSPEPVAEAPRVEKVVPPEVVEKAASPEVVEKPVSPEAVTVHHDAAVVEAVAIPAAEPVVQPTAIPVDAPVSVVEAAVEASVATESHAAERKANAEEDSESQTAAPIEYIPAVIAPAEAAERDAATGERPRSFAEAFPPMLRRSARWVLGAVAIALLGAGGAAFALGRVARAPEPEPLATLQQSSRGAIEEPQAGSIQHVSQADAGDPAVAHHARRAATPYIPDWDRAAPVTGRAARIPSRSHARQLTRTMERLGNKVMAGVDVKVDSMTRAVELPPPNFGKP